MNSKILYPFLFLLIFSIFPYTLLYQEINAQTYPEVSIEPQQTIYAVPLTRFSIDIRVTNVYQLYSYQFNITWSPTVLEVENKSMLVEGDFLKRGGAYTTITEVKLNQTIGYAFVGTTLLKPAIPATGTGNLYTITFLVKTKGDSLLILKNTRLLDNFGAVIAHTVANSSFTTGKVSLVPAETIKRDPSLGETFNLNATVEGVQDLMGLQCTIEYNNTVFNVTSADFGPLLEPNSNFTIIDRDQGRITLNLTQPSGSEPVNQSGTLATFSFTILDVGATWFRINSSILLDVNNQTIIHVTQDAYFSNKYRNISVVSIETSATEATEGDKVKITVTVKNNGTLSESFTVKVYVNQSLIAEFPVTDLDPGQEEAGETEFDTTGLQGDYTLVIRAQVPALPDESETADNTMEVTKNLTVHPRGMAIPMELLIGVAVVVIVVIVAIVFFMKRKK